MKLRRHCIAIFKCTTAIMSTALAKQIPLRAPKPVGGVIDHSPVSSGSSQDEKNDASSKEAHHTIHTHRLTDLNGELGAPADEKRFWWQRGKTFGM